MRILHVVGLGKLPKNPDREAVGGLTRVTVELARVQAARGHRVVIAAVGRKGWRADWQGVRLVSLAGVPHAGLGRLLRKSNLPMYLPLLAFAARYRFDVIHAHEFCHLRYLPARVRITHFHNDPFSHPGDERVAAYEATQCLAAARYSHAHVAVSRFIAERLGRRYDTISAELPSSFDASARTHVVYNGVDLDRFRPEAWGADRHRLRSSWKTSEDDVVFLYSGAIVPEKGVLELARAFVSLSRTNSRARLVVAGHARLWEDDRSPGGANEEHARYQRAVVEELAQLTGCGRVIHLGMVAPEALPGVYAAADVIVVPSIAQEAFCLSAAEGLAMGKPLIASRVGGLSEFARAENSLLIAPGDEGGWIRALRLLAADDVHRGRLAENARQSVSTYTWVRAARELDELYEALLLRGQSIVCAKPPAFYRL